MVLLDLEASSDEEYFPTSQELEAMEDEDQMDTEDNEEEDDEEAGAEDVEEPYDPDYIEDSDDIDVEEILLRSNPGLLRQIQQVLQHGIGLRSASSTARDEGSRRRNRRRLQDLPATPYIVGKHLLNSGEFGEVDDHTAKKRLYHGARTISQLARFRELGWRRENTLILTKRWLPDERKGRIVAQYDRHVYSGQFSHDGSFFYTASQDFKCRMYQTLNPAHPKDWKLYKVPSLL